MLTHTYGTHIHSTTQEIKDCCKDLKVLNKSDFKGLIKWRLGLRAFRDELIKDQGQVLSHEHIHARANTHARTHARTSTYPHILAYPKSRPHTHAYNRTRLDQGGDQEKEAGSDDDEDDTKEPTEEEREEGIMEEIRARQEEAQHKRKREKRKERQKDAKLRERQALGMNHNAFDIPEQEEVAAHVLCVSGGMDGRG